jgi:hypothetical protein
MKILFPNIKNIDEINLESNPLKPFCDEIIEFVNELSNTILKNPYFKNFPELIALGFWMRKSNIEKLKKYFFSKEKVLIGRGVVFHIAPSNVDTIFAYSFILSLLVGNSNIVRISTKKSLQINLLVDLIISVLEKYEFLKKRMVIVKYSHNDEITEKLSLMADVRVIWGSDETINHIRKIPIKPTAIELIFADKFSFSLINAKKVNEKNIDFLIEKFYNDAFLFSQMACSSIRLVVWYGENDKARKFFWDRLSEFTLKKLPEISPSEIMNKYVSLCSMAIENDVKIEIKNPYISIVEIEKFSDINTNLHCGGGIFYELKIKNFNEIMPFIIKKYQTLAYYGFSKDELINLIYNYLPQGIDRIVPVGKAMEFNHIWDGYDLLNSFCREIYIEI